MLHRFHPHPRHRRSALVALLAAFALFATSCVSIATPTGWPALAATEDGVIITQVAAGRVAAIDPEDGRQLWLFPDQLPGGAIDPANDDIDLGATYATPVIDGDTIYLASYDGVVVRVAMDGNRIEVIWYADLAEEVVATPVLNNGRLYVATDTGAVVVLNAESGTIEQRYTVSGGRIWGRPALDGDVLYLSDLDERITLAFDVGGGIALWETGLTAASPADIVQDGQLLLVGSFDRALHALDAATGEELWRFRGDGWFVGAPLVDGDTLYAATMRGSAHAVDRNGNEVWAFRMEGEEFRASPLLIDGTVVIASRGGVIVGLDAASGTRQWESPVPDARINAHGLVLDGAVYYITTDHELLRVDASTGAVQRFSVAR